MADIYHQAEIVQLFKKQNCIHLMQAADRDVRISVDTYKGVAAYRPDLLDVSLIDDLLEDLKVLKALAEDYRRGRNERIRLNYAELEQQLIERGRA